MERLAELAWRALVTLFIYLGVTAVTTLMAAIVQAAGGSLLAQCATAFLPGLIPAVICWRSLR
jgi:hypothetical protein